MKSLTNKILKILAIMIFVLSIGLCGCAEKTITSIDSMTLSTSSYQGGGTVYKIADKDEKLELCRYRVVYSGVEENLELEKSSVCDTQEFIELVNACGLIHWDGFSKDNHDVMDGTSFYFTATVNDGQTISADGYSEFPNGYIEFVSGLRSILEE